MNKYSVEQYVKTTKFLDKILWSKNEDYIIYSSDEKGSFDLYKYTFLTNSSERITQLNNTTIPISEIPNSDDFIFSFDSNGNEKSHLYLYTENKEIIDLTPWEGSRNQFLFWHPNNSSFFITSNKRDSKSMDIYEIDLKSETSKLIYENTDYLYFNDISPCSNYIICEKTIHRGLSKVFLLNLFDSKLTLISDDEKQANDIAYKFTKDGQSLYFVTNYNNEFDSLYLLDLKTKKRTLLYTSGSNIVGFKLNEKKDIGIIEIFHEATHKIKILDLTNYEIIPFKPKADFILTANFSKSSNFLVYKSQDSNIPYRISLYNLSSQNEKKLIDGRNLDINNDSYIKAKDVYFNSFDGLEIPAIFYTSSTATPSTPSPAMIWVHGGPGGVSMHNFSFEFQYYLNNGISILAVNNRGSYGYGKTFHNLDTKRHGKDDLMDCIYGKKYLESLNYIKKDSIGIFGGSYGGYIVGAALAFHPKEFKLGVDIFGVMNWVRTLKIMPDWWEAEKERIYQHIGNPYTEEDYLRSISPLFHADKIEKPLLVAQGANDPRVIKAESDEIVEIIKQNNIPVEYLLFDDEGHGFMKTKNRKIFIEKCMKFIDKHI